MANKKAKPIPAEDSPMLELFYMSPIEVSAKEIVDLLKEEEGITTELWEYMNVLELILPNGHSIDFEPLTPNFKNPSDAAFLKNRNIKTIYAIQVSEEDLISIMPCFNRIVAKYSGFVCSDSVDFQPVYAGSCQK